MRQAFQEYGCRSSDRNHNHEFIKVDKPLILSNEIAGKWIPRLEHFSRKENRFVMAMMHLHNISSENLIDVGYYSACSTT